MDNLLKLGKTIKERRLSLNLRMEDVAKKAETTRATLWAIEKGTSNCSVKTLFKVMEVLGLEMTLNNSLETSHSRDRASRVNTALSRKTNRFLIMCVMQYASSVGVSSEGIYRKMQEIGLLDELEEDYEDLHGMSTVYLNDYIEARLEGA